jgi:sulfur-oxidizing protein SoxY
VSAERHDPERRRWLRRLLALATLPMLGAWRAALAARPVRAFHAEKLDETIAALAGDALPVTSDKITIGMAELAENGAVVPVKIEVDLPEVREIAILASRNPVPLLASFELGPKTRPFVATRVKLAESCDVYAVVRTANGVYIARKAVRVTVGGCGTIS